MSLNVISINGFTIFLDQVEMIVNLDTIPGELVYKELKASPAINLFTTSKNPHTLIVTQSGRAYGIETLYNRVKQRLEGYELTERPTSDTKPPYD